MKHVECENFSSILNDSTLIMIVRNLFGHREEENV